MNTPSYSPPPVDPMTKQAEKTANNELIAGLQTQARGDMGSLMAAYGTLAMGIGSTPPAAPKMDLGEEFGTAAMQAKGAA